MFSGSLAVRRYTPESSRWISDSWPGSIPHADRRGALTGQTGVPTLEQFHEDFQDADKLADMTKEAGFDEWHQLFNNKNRGCSVIACGEQPTMQRYVRIASNPQSHTLERNAYYWKVDPAGNQLPYIDGVTIHVVQDREVLVLKAIQGEFDLFGQNSALADVPVYQENKEKGRLRRVQLAGDRCQPDGHPVQPDHRGPGEA